MAENPTSSSTMYTTLAAPAGAFGGSNGDQSGTESRMSTLTLPLNGSLIDVLPGVCRDVRIAAAHRRTVAANARRCRRSAHHPDRMTCATASPRQRSRASPPGWSKVLARSGCFRRQRARTRGHLVSATFRAAPRRSRLVRTPQKEALLVLWILIGALYLTLFFFLGL